MKAVIETGGKQYLVEEGSVIYVEKLDCEAGKKYTFDKVVMAGSKVGTPYVNGASVEAKVEKHGKQKKVVIFIKSKAFLIKRIGTLTSYINL